MRDGKSNNLVEDIIVDDQSAGMLTKSGWIMMSGCGHSGEDRRPTLTFPRNIPFDEEPSDTHKEIKMNANFHSASNIPKLFINADPGFLLVGSQRDEVRSWVNIKEVTVDGNHFIQEDSPDEIAQAIEKWLN